MSKVAQDAWKITSLSGHTSDTAPALSLNFSNKTYLFGAGENLLRNLLVQKQTFTKFGPLFLSQLDQENAGGLYGYVHGMTDAKVKTIDLYGPQNLEYYLACGRYALRRPGTTVNCHPVTPLSADEPLPLVLSDTNLSVYAIPVQSSTTTLKRKRSRSPSPAQANKRTRYDNLTTSSYISADLRQASSFRTDQFDVSESENWIKLVLSDMFRPTGQNLEGKRTPAWDPRRLSPPPSQTRDVVSYLCVGPKMRGKFQVEKAKRLGVKPGPDFGKLVQGESVFVDGREVKHDDVVDVGEPASAVLVLCCPDESCIESVLDNTKKIEDTLKQQEAKLICVVHQTSADVLENEKYQEWMLSLPQGIQHSIAAPEYSSNSVTFVSTTLQQMRRNRLDPSMFPIPKYNLTPQRTLSDLTALSSLSLQPLSSLRISSTGTPLPASTLRSIDFSPEDSEAEAHLSLLKLPSESPLWPQIKERTEKAWSDYIDLVPKVKASIADAPAREAVSGGDIIITTLGTGSAVPSQYRNVSSTLMRDPQKGTSFMLDCGEATWGQMCRQFGVQQARDMLCALDFFFISHMHGDHHGGLPSLLAERAKAATRSPLYIVAPPYIKTYLFDLNALEDLGLDDITFFDANRLLASETDFADVRFQQMLDNSGLTSMRTVLVEHRARCFGLVLEGREGWKIVFSGDTGPCAALVEAGKDATLLIHEATMEDDLVHLAKSKGHSTIGQALSAAKDMNVQHVLLNHFSQRYPKMASFEGQGIDSKPIIAVAFDGFNIAIKDMWKMHHLYPAISAISQEYEAGLKAEPIQPKAVRGKTGTKPAKKQKSKTKEIAAPVSV